MSAASECALRVYLDFMSKVAEGRGMSAAAVHKVAKGRIWSGGDALQRGLVDSLGGLADAIHIAKQEASLSTVTLLTTLYVHVMHMGFDAQYSIPHKGCV